MKALLSFCVSVAGGKCRLSQVESSGCEFWVTTDDYEGEESRVDGEMRQQAQSREMEKWHSE